MTSVLITNSCKPHTAGTFNMYIVFIEKTFVMKITFFRDRLLLWTGLVPKRNWLDKVILESVKWLVNFFWPSFKVGKSCFFK